VNDEATVNERISYEALLSLSARRCQMNPTAMTTERPTQDVSVRTRTARLDDAAPVAELAGQLGHPVTPGDIQSRLEVCLGDEDHLLLVAESHDGQIVGWLHATVSRSLVDEPTCQIAGLVVDEKSRRNGIGRALMQHAEAWAARRGLKWISLRSNVLRNEAHKFYERLGYERVKTQHAYRKRLAPQRT
jgi:GNAT superfamily N-acetyltransferase